MSLLEQSVYLLLPLTLPLPPLIKIHSALVVTLLYVQTQKKTKNGNTCKKQNTTLISVQLPPPGLHLLSLAHASFSRSPATPTRRAICSREHAGQLSLFGILVNQALSQL